MAKRKTTKIGVARKRCKGKKGTKLKKCMRNVMSGGKSGRKKRK